MINKRIESLDAIRGLALMFILLFHCSIYNFANIHKLDFSNPPVLIILMSFMALWGGMFVIYSQVVNTLMLMRRGEKGSFSGVYKYLLGAGLIYLFLHYVLNIFLGRWNIDFVNNMPHLTFIAATLRTGHVMMPPVSKLFEGSSLSTIAFNLIIVSGVVALLFRNNGIKKQARNYLILGITGFLILVLSFLRVLFYPAFTRSLESDNYLMSTIYSFTLANPYPLLPYLSYGFFGAMTGMMIYSGRNDLLKKIVIPAGFLFFVYGVAGMMNFDKTISKPDYFWYFKTCFELGTFLMLAVLIVLGLEKKARFLKGVALIRWFGRISLTIYLLETFLSELLRIIGDLVIKGWDQTINGCLLFGFINILVWSAIVFFWKKVDFKFSLEYFWVKAFEKNGKHSTKLDFKPKFRQGRS